jgi:DNA-binding transcriptional MerR regulator
MDVQQWCSYASIMPTISDFKKAYSVQPNTIRAWSRTFADYLTPGANPGKGETRIYTGDDARVIAQVAAMRQERASYETIRAALAAGDRGQWPLESDKPTQDAPGGDENTFALVTRLTAKASALEGELGAIKGERDYLRLQLTSAQDVAQDAQIRAAAAESRLQVLEELQTENAAQGEKIGFWRRLFSGE